MKLKMIKQIGESIGECLADCGQNMYIYKYVYKHMSIFLYVHVFVKLDNALREYRQRDFMPKLMEKWFYYI